MGPQDSSIPQQQYDQLQRQSSVVDFEAAEQLLQHSRSGRESNGESMSGLGLEQEASTTFPGSPGHRTLGDGPLENGNENGGSHLQERHAEAQYAPINNQPPLGQVCRYAQSYAFQM